VQLNIEKPTTFLVEPYMTKLIFMLTTLGLTAMYDDGPESNNFFKPQHIYCISDGIFD